MEKDRAVSGIPQDVTTRTVFAAFDRWKQAEDIMALSECDRTLVLVWSMMGIIPGEGLEDFYETSTAEYDSENVASLERIGANQAASFLRRANEISARWMHDYSNRLEREQAHFEATGQRVYEERSPADQAELDELETSFCNCLEDIESLLRQYVERHLTR